MIGQWTLNNIDDTMLSENINFIIYNSSWKASAWGICVFENTCMLQYTLNFYYNIKLEILVTKMNM